MDNRLGTLYESLSGRHRPEQILSTIANLPAVRRAVPSITTDLRAARNWGSWGWSSMSSDFDAPKPPQRLARSLLERADMPHLTDRDLTDPAVLRGVLEIVFGELGSGRSGTHRQWRHRLDRAGRRRTENRYPRRQYNRVFRMALQLERETQALEHQLVLFQLGREAKTVYASKLSEEEFRLDELTAALVAYMAANLGRRSLFIAGPQARALDDIAATLLRAMEARKETNWFAVAHIHPAPEVLRRVEPERLTLLLGHALESMRVAGLELQRVYETTNPDLAAMIVRRGQDSSTWNATAGAWNKARQVWLSCMAALGREDAIDEFCPGKVMRLMAADVAYWHRSGGGDVDPDTKVWASLPKPWEVLFGEAQCTRALVEASCREVRVDAVKSGWSRPRAMTRVEPWKPTPETVHGVAVADPTLAVWLRKIGVFSGKSIRPEQVAAFEEKFGAQAAFVVSRQLQGESAFAVGADWAPAEVATTE